jgi:hypothetical protein
MFFIYNFFNFLKFIFHINISKQFKNTKKPNSKYKNLNFNEKYIRQQPQTNKQHLNHERDVNTVFVLIFLGSY